MTIVITPADIKEICPSTLPDAVIEDLICMVQDRIGECVEASYVECTAKMILKYSVCHFVEQTQGDKVKSKKAANGASVTFDNAGTSSEGLDGTNAGRLVMSIDTAGCSSALVTTTLFIGSFGNAARVG